MFFDAIFMAKCITRSPRLSKGVLPCPDHELFDRSRLIDPEYGRDGGEMTEMKLRMAIGLLLAWPIATGLTLPARGPLPKPRPDIAAPAPETNMALSSQGAASRDTADVAIPQNKPTPPVAKQSSTREEPEASSSADGAKDTGSTADLQHQETPLETRAVARDDATGDGMANDAEPARQTVPADPPPPAEEPKALAACLADLRAIGARFETQPAIDGDTGCGMAAPVTLKTVLPDITLEPAATLRCETALQIARMTRDMLKPAAEAAFPDRKTLTGIRDASAYVCRNRNGADTGKVSEHAYGNAIDIAALRFGDEEMPVLIARQDDGTAEAAFQRAFNAFACLYFTTVLSPGSDATHQDHMHLDVIERTSGFRYCR